MTNITRKEFIKNLVKNNYIEKALFYRDNSLNKNMLLFNKVDGIFYWKLKDLFKDYIKNTNDDLSFYISKIDLDEYANDYLKDYEHVIEYKIIGKDLIEREYNKLLNEEDMKDHISVGCVILDLEKNKILMLDHVKFDMITIPVGKGKEGQTPFEAIHQEVKEEVNLDIKKAMEIAVFNIDSYRNDKIVRLYNHLFVVTTNDIDLSTLKNMEPKKHRDMFWMDLEDIKRLKTRSFMTKVFIDTLNKGYISTKITYQNQKYSGLYILQDGCTHKVEDIEYKVVANKYSL